MKYFKQIESFFNKKMTGAEQEAFEHEVVDSSDLAKELDAYQTGAELLDFTAVNLSDEQILGLEKQDTPSKAVGKRPIFANSRLVVLLGAVAVLLLVVFWGISLQNQPEATPVKPVDEKEQPAKDMPIAGLSPSLGEPSSEHEYLSAVVEDEESITVNVPPIQSTEIKKTVTGSSLQNRSSDRLSDLKKETTKSNNLPSSPELTSNASIASGEKIVYQAVQQITLAPGFHAKAGSSFKAMVKKN